MRPHRLRMTAFGPFADTVEVDLDRLASGGLFLLHGETGAGKTTLLDGLGFALYGRVPGVRHTGGRLRSDHAEPRVRTEVQLEATLGGRRWRITRSPAQERPRARGSGSTTEPAKVLLEEHRAGRWTTVSTRIDEAAAELDRLLGMSADQFFQVVLLPQGEFAQFLRADSKERGLLLQRLFGTQRFRAVEEWLAARRSSTAALSAAARQELQVLIARLAQAAGVDVPAAQAGDLDDPPGSAGLAPDWVGQTCRAATLQAADAAALVEAATAHRDAARSAAADATRLAERQARRRTALAAYDVLALEQPGQVELGIELTAADSAAELAPVLHDATSRAAAALTSLGTEAALRAELRAAGLPVDADTAALRTAADAARERAGRLDGLRPLADDLARERAAQAQAGQESAACRCEVDRVTAVLAVLPGRRARAQLQVGAGRAAAAQLPDRVAALVAFTAAAAESRSLTVALDQLDELRDEHLLARETAVSLREKESELRDARLTSMVAELAGTLEPGSPCEVCGSLQHPDPYEGAGDSVSREDEERARTEAERATQRVADVAARLAVAASAVHGHRARLAEAGHADAQLQVLLQQCAAVTAQVQALRSAAAGLDDALAAAERLDGEQARGDTDLARAAGEGAAAERRGDEARARAEVFQARLLAELEGAPDLPAALAAAHGCAAACEAVLVAAERAAGARAEAARAANTAASGARAAGFDGPDQARAALRPADWRSAARRRRREHDDRAAAAAAALADPELAVAPEPAADAATAAAALAAADAVLGQAVGELAAARGRSAQVVALAPRLEAALAALGAIEERAGLARRLADLCAGGGSNSLRMSLSSFVLAARLEEVAAAASTRLLRMTQGRYALLHTDGAARGGARSGLGLLVRDSWTGRDRATGTLSGGETFQASLALALGLADVVQAEAGGTRIEALFVDEGFGTLDEQTLDEVMDVLDGLREGGRLVGLVSHVAELKARIPAQVHVRKARAGSTLVVTGC